MLDWFWSGLHAVNANAGAAQVLLAAVLVGITYWYARTTKRLAQTAQAQRRDGVMPLIVFDLVQVEHLGQAPRTEVVLVRGNASAAGFTVRYLNIGTGPALNVVLGLEGSQIEYRGEEPGRVETLATDDSRVRHYSAAALLPAMSQEESRQRHEELARTPVTGVIRATYEDVFQRTFRSEAALRRQAGDETGLTIRVGSLQFYRPDD
jgi:hypothetical protein